MPLTYQSMLEKLLEQAKNDRIELTPEVSAGIHQKVKEILEEEDAEEQQEMEREEARRKRLRELEKERLAKFKK